MKHLNRIGICRGSIRKGIFEPALRFNGVTLAQGPDIFYAFRIEAGVIDPLIKCTGGLGCISEGVRIGALCT